MKRLLITGADGFVGRWVTRAALLVADEVVAGISPEGAGPAEWLSADEVSRVRMVRGDLRDPATIAALVDPAPDAVIHLAAIASGPAARRDPTLAWAVNAGVTAALAEACAGTGTAPRFLLASTGEVYGRGHTGPISETAALVPISPYAATKVGAEEAAREVARRTGLPLLIARPFPHSGPGQSTQFVFPALAERLREAKARGLETITVGNLEPVRDLLDVRDVATAYLGIVARGTAGEAYNIASGTGLRLLDGFHLLARLIGSAARAVVDPALLRTADLPVLIGNPAKLVAETGWRPSISMERTFQDW